MNYEELLSAASLLSKRIDFKPEIAVVLGSGLGAFADSLTNKTVIGYEEVGLYKSTVEGHKGQFVFGFLEGSGVLVAVMQGRLHHYEGLPLSAVVAPVRILKLLGIKAVLLTNAAGGINWNFSAGSFMAINDHINMIGNPLIGKNIDSLGLRFPDMSKIYDYELTESLKKAAEQLDIELFEGVYYAVSGPSFETPAEIRMMRTVGADAVGMSTAPEAVAARHAGLRVAGLSLISNLAAGMAGELSHTEVNEVSERAKDSYQKLLALALKNMNDVVRGE